MKQILPLTCVLFVILLAGCGGSNDEPAIKVDETKVPKPTDMSGSVVMKEQTFTITLDAPNPSWSVKISDIYVVGQEIWVLAKLHQQKGDMVAQVISPISDSVTVSAPDIAPIYYLIPPPGSSWKPDVPGVEVINNTDSLASGFAQGEKIWPQ